MYQTVPAIAKLRVRFDGRVEGDGKRLSLNTALGVYLVLTELANEVRADDFQASQTQIATMAGSTRQTVNRYLAVFVELGLVEVERVTGRNGDEPSFYALTESYEDASQPPPGGNSGDTHGVGSGDTVLKKEEDSSLRSEGESARAARLKISGKPVDPEVWRRTEAVLDEFNRQAGKKLRLVSSDGSPSEAAKRIYGRIAKYRDLKFEDFADIIRRTLASRWWGDGELSPGVVFGPKVFEDNITRTGVAADAKKAEKDARTREDLAAIQRILARKESGE